MLKAIIQVKNDIVYQSQLTAFIKRKEVDYESKKKTKQLQEK